MTAQASRRRLVAIAHAAHRAGIPATRGARLSARSIGKMADRVSLREVAVWPSWPGAVDDEQVRVWRIAALIAAHDALGNVIDGQRLRAYAALVGDDALDAVLALPAGGNAPLAVPEQLADQGRQVAECGLPAGLAAALEVTAVHMDTARDHVVCAERIARENAA